MFTGIIEGVGKILRIESSPHARLLEIAAPFSLNREKIGDSIAVEGSCLTVVKKTKNRFSVEVSPETLKITTLGNLKIGDEVNLERALKLSDRLGGHWVQGHVDGVLTLKSKKEVKVAKTSYLFLNFAYPQKFKKYFVVKGSITLSGVSLTINELSTQNLSVCLIPHTQKNTTLTGLKPGAKVNFEVDILAKYLESLSRKR